MGGGDRLTIDLPGMQEELLKAVYATGTPVVLVLMSGSAVAVNWADENVPAILEAWYGGEESGRAVADVIFGDFSPSGRLPVTFYKSIDQLPPFEDYDMKGHTYRFFEGEPLYSFGDGLGFVKFAYSNLKISPDGVEAGGEVEASVDVENTGGMEAGEVVQLYLEDVEASVPVPLRQLRGFRRIELEPGEKKTVSFTLLPEHMSCFEDDGTEVVEPGEFRVSVGGAQPTSRFVDSGDVQVLEGAFTLTGSRVILE